MSPGNKATTQPNNKNRLYSNWTASEPLDEAITGPSRLSARLFWADTTHQQTQPFENVYRGEGAVISLRWLTVAYPLKTVGVVLATGSRPKGKPSGERARAQHAEHSIA
ncbi:hypothetical protein FRC20_000756 [Serendipita sp. 405]|nr:hypothetical protein FRC20_000756 [Serendipita sp. 405]